MLVCTEDTANPIRRSGWDSRLAVGGGTAHGEHNQRNARFHRGSFSGSDVSWQQLKFRNGRTRGQFRNE